MANIKELSKKNKNEKQKRTLQVVLEEPFKNKIWWNSIRKLLCGCIYATEHNGFYQNHHLDTV